MAISQFDVGRAPLLIGLLGGPQVTVTVTAGDTLYYDFQPNVSASVNSGSLTAGQSFTSQEQLWVVSASRSSVNLAYLQETDAASSSTGPQLPLSVGNAVSAVGFVPTLAQDGATDDRAAIQAALNQAHTAGGGHVFVPYLGGGGVCIIGASLVIYSNTKLELDPQVTIRLKSGVMDNLIRNNAAGAARTVWDTAVTNLSATVTSASVGNFTSADVGQPVLLWPDGDASTELFATTVQSVTNSTTLVLAAAPPAAFPTVAATAMTIGARDSNIEVCGGTWDRGTNGGSAANGTASQNLFFRRVDNLKLHDYGVVSTGGKYETSLGDVRDVTYYNVTLNAASDGCCVRGPATRVFIQNQHGTTSDDFVSILGGEVTGLMDTGGPITHVDVRGLFPQNYATPNAVKIIPGSAGTSGTPYKMRHINIDGVYGSAAQQVIAIWDDTNGVNMQFGDVSNVRCRNVHCDVGSSHAVYNISARTVGDVEIDGLWLNPNNAGTTTYAISVLTNTVSLAKLTVKNVYVNASSWQGLLNVASPAAITELDIDGLYVTGNPAPKILNFVTGCAVANTRIRRFNLAFSGSAAIVQNNATATSGTQLISLEDGAMTGGSTGVVHGSGNPTARIRLTDVDFGGAFGNVVSTFSAADIDINGVSTSNNLLNVGAAVNVNVRGGAIGGSGSHLTTSNSPSVFVRNPFFQADVTKLTGTQGAVAYNTNAGTTVPTGVVEYDGSRWRSLNTPRAVKTYTLTLNGTTAVTQADTAITASSIINVYTTLGAGTVGSPYVSALTAGTSFAVKSTTAGDTSTVQAEVVQY